MSIAKSCRQPRSSGTTGLLRPTRTNLVAGLAACVAVAAAVVVLPWPAAAGASTVSARPVAPPTVDRRDATVTLLDGSVLVAGGSPDPQPAEVFEPVKGEWSRTGAMVSPRVGHTATELGAGRVLVAGGVIAGESTASTELYDPAARTWTAATPMSQPRSFHTATVLNDGRVLVAGGQAGGHGPFAREAEILDPVAGTWSPAGTIEQGRSFHAATLLADGRVLVTGGQGDSHGTSLRDGAVYDPAANDWSVVPQLMAVGRSQHSATLLAGGAVLVAGGTPQRQGDNDGDQIQASAEIYDPADWSFRPLPPMRQARAAHAALALPDGRVLVVGGQSSANGAVVPAATAELFDPRASRWLGAGSLVRAEGSGRTVGVLLAGQGCGGACGQVLVVDGGAQLLEPPRGSDVAGDARRRGDAFPVSPWMGGAAVVVVVGLPLVVFGRVRSGRRRAVGE